MGVTGWGGVTLYVEIDLSQAVENTGSSLSSSLVSLWDGATWNTSTWAGGTTWTDVTADVRSVKIRAAANRQSNRWTASSLTVELDNLSGDYSPDNTSSVYRVGASTTIGIWRPIRVRASYAGTSWPLFTGRIRSWEESFPNFAADAIVTVGAVDGFGQLAAFNGYATTPVGASEASGARIHRLLTNAGWDAGRYIDDGEITCAATDLGGNALQELQVTADSEGGAIWCDPDGSFMFDGQYALIEKTRSNTIQATFADDGTSGALNYSSVNGSYDGDLVVNMAAYARVGGSVQTFTAEESRALYGDRQAARSDLVSATDGQVLTLATRDVALGQDPERRIEGLSFYPQRNGTAGWTALATRKIQQRALCRVIMTPPRGDKLNRLVHVSGLHHTIGHPRNGGSWKVELEFSSATVWYGLVGSTWDNAVWGTHRWAW